MKVENLKDVSFTYIGAVLGKLSLHSLNQAYEYFHKEMLLSNTLNSEIYVDEGYETKEEREYKERINNHCMRNISRSEIILGYIEQEIELRNIHTRFNI